VRGHIRPRGKNNYTIVVDLDPDSEGKRRQKWISVAKYLGQPKATKKQAETILTEILQKINNHDYIETEDITLGEYLDHWLENYAKQSVRTTTYDNYTSLIKKHIKPELEHIRLARLSPLHLQEFYNKKLVSGRADGKPGGLSAKTVRELHSLLHKALDQAVKWQTVSKNVARAVSPPRKEKKQINYWTKEEVKTFLADIEGERLYALYYLALNTGMRRGELLGLRWSDLRLEDGYVAVRQNLVKTDSGIMIQEPKTANSRRNISISPKTIEVLKRHKDTQDYEKEKHEEDYNDHGLVFCRLNGLPLYPDGASDQFNRLVKNSKVKRISFHDIRHTHATLLLVAGVHPKVVSERLGHFSVALTLDLYSHVIPGMDQEASIRLDEHMM
jgi:integrase